MTEFYTIKRIDNSRLLRLAPPDHLRDCFRRAGWGAMLALCGLLYAWQHFQNIQLRYQIEEMQADRVRASELNQQLHNDLDGLVAASRIDRIAHERLGLTVVTPSQIAPIEAASDAVVAQARNVSQPNRP
jgi:cell division protein FtsL